MTKTTEAECADCPMASPDECLSVSHCEHRDGPREAAAAVTAPFKALSAIFANASRTPQREEGQ